MRMRRAWMLFSVLWASVTNATADEFIIAGPDAAWQNESGEWAWDGGAYLEAFRHTIEGRAFGVSGEEPTSVVTRDLFTIDGQRLSDVDVFVSPWWSDNESNGAVAISILEFFFDGGGLILLQDDADHDRIGSALGFPTTAANEDQVSSGSGPLFDGVFGTVGDIEHSGWVGQISGPDVIAAGGHIAATNALGEVTAAYWFPGEFSVGAGPLLIITDIDTITEPTADYSVRNDNARFALNAVSFMIPDYVLGGPGLNFQSGHPWAWDDSVRMRGLREALEDSSRFSPEGEVTTRINTKNLPWIDAETLSRLDGFIVPTVEDDALSDEEAQAIIDFFLEGGDLILTQDNNGFDKVGAMLGLPTISGTSSTSSTGGMPLFEGPFGDVPSIEHVGLGALDEADVVARGGQVVARNQTNDVTAAIWKPRTFGPAAGALVILPDLDVLGSLLADYATMNNEAQFTLNLFSFAVRDYLLGGPAASIHNGGLWRWDDGLYLKPYREAIEQRHRFGNRGIVRRTIDTCDLDSIDATSLMPLDGFVVPYWADGDISDPMAQAIVDFFLQGGDLFILQDNANFDRIGELLGLPALSSSDGPSSGLDPLASSVFGHAEVIEHYGSRSRLDPVAIANRNGHIGTTNSHQEVTSAYWNPGEFAPNAGRLVVAGDIDMISELTADYSSIDEDNASFALNTTAFLTAGGTVVRYGEGCPGTGDVTPSLRVYGCLSLDNEARILVHDTPGGTAGLLIFGYGGRANLEFTPGCELLIGPPYLFVPFNTRDLGGAHGGLFYGEVRIPSKEVLADVQINIQALLFDGGAASGVATTNAVEAIISR